MKRFMFLLAVVLTCMSMSASIFGAKKITIHVLPEEATIYRDGMDVGTGSYTVEFKGGAEFVTLRLEAPGYMSRRITVRKDNPKKDIMYKLSEDEARKNSVGVEDGGRELANKWFDVTCRKGMSEDVIWKRLMNIAVKNFEDIEVRDKAAGWIKTAWATTKFRKQDVRTRMEIRLSFADGDTPTYRVRLVSEKRDFDDGNGSYEKYDRLLNKFEPVIAELTTTVGSDL
ncbi:MAG: PEGA domain-containing protein [Bacteroides sp.]|nr:PEGA domain-containing protein [Bacteroides sp.]